MRSPRHLFVCTNVRGSGKPTCGVTGTRIAARVATELVTRHAIGCLVTETACLGPCFDGPNAVVYPDGVWYGNLDEADAAALCDHLIDGTILTAKQTTRPGSE